MHCVTCAALRFWPYESGCVGLLASMIDTGAVGAASLMAPVVVGLVRVLLHPGDRPAPTRLTGQRLDLAPAAEGSMIDTVGVSAHFDVDVTHLGAWRR